MIEKFAASTNVTAQFTTVDVKKSPDQMTTSLAATGSFADLYRFTALLEQAPYELSITSADFSPTALPGIVPEGKGPHPSGWRANITMALTSVTGVTVKK